VTRDEVEAELFRIPFHPFRLHLVSGKTVDVNDAGDGWMFKRSILITRRRKSGQGGYNVVSLMNIERLERLDELRNPARRHYAKDRR
jgi:hypothetical protein